MAALALIGNRVDESCEEIGQRPILIETVKGTARLEVCSLAEVWVTVEEPLDSNDIVDIVRVGRASLSAPWRWKAESDWPASEAKAARAIADSVSEWVVEHPLMFRTLAGESLVGSGNPIGDLCDIAHGLCANLTDMSTWSEERQFWAEYTRRPIDNLTADDYNRIVNAVRRLEAELLPLARKATATVDYTRSA
jgi:hypothetical protein